MWGATWGSMWGAAWGGAALGPSVGRNNVGRLGVSKIVSKIVSRMQADASRGGSSFARDPTCPSLHAPTPPWGLAWGQGAARPPSAHRRPPCPLWHWLGGGWGAAIRGHKRGPQFGSIWRMGLRVGQQQGAFWRLVGLPLWMHKQGSSQESLEDTRRFCFDFCK